jgi:hypothetical protein
MRELLMHTVGLNEVSGGERILRDERERGQDHEQEDGQGSGESHGVRSGSMRLF